MSRPSARSFAAENLEMTDSFGQHERRPLGADALSHVRTDERVPGFVGSQLTQDPLELDALIGGRFSLDAEACRPDEHVAGERRSPVPLQPGIHPAPDGTALHEHDGVMTVLPRHRRRQSRDVLRLGATDGQFESAGGNMVALVHDHEAVVRDAVVHLAAPHQALHHGDVNRSGELPPSPSQATDLPFRDAQKLGQPGDPLIQQL